jgi:hypothetical protein
LPNKPLLKGPNIFLIKLLYCEFQEIGLGLSIPLAPFDNLRTFSFIEAGDLHYQPPKKKRKND